VRFELRFGNVLQFYQKVIKFCVCVRLPYVSACDSIFEGILIIFIIIRIFKKDTGKILFSNYYSLVL